MLLNPSGSNLASLPVSYAKVVPIFSRYSTCPSYCGISILDSLDCGSQVKVTGSRDVHFHSDFEYSNLAQGLSVTLALVHCSRVGLTPNSHYPDSIQTLGM